MAIPIHESSFSWKSLLPGSLGSLSVHVLILLIASWSMRGCQQGVSGTAGGDMFREVGLFVVTGDDADAADGDTSNRDTDNSKVESDSSDTADDQQTTVETSRQQSVVPQEAPQLSQYAANLNPFDPVADSATDTEFPSLTGPGVPLSGLPSAAAAEAALRGGGGSSGQQAAGAAISGPGETAFMNVRGMGNRFVYVIDVSGSMGQDNRLALARSQLKASLRLLQPTQEFQVIFYSEYPMRMKLRGQSQRSMYPATAANLLWAAREIDAVQPQNGTEHKPALLEAISLKPDVIYFLTDGREPQLFPADLNDVRRLSGRITIHVIEFGSGSLSDRSESWLQRLARQSNGEYREFNTTGWSATSR